MLDLTYEQTIELEKNVKLGLERVMGEISATSKSITNSQREIEDLTSRLIQNSEEKIQEIQRAGCCTLAPNPYPQDWRYVRQHI